jgi:hypothetical protein
MAAKKKAPPVDPFQEYEQRLGKLEDLLHDFDEGVGYDFELQGKLIAELREDLVGRDKVIWVVLDQHNARIHEIKHHIIGVVGEGDEPDTIPLGTVVPSEDEKAPTWFVVLVLAGFAALIAVFLYALFHVPL